MSEAIIGDIFTNALYIVLAIVVVIIVPSLIIGLMVSTFQAATQINEQTLSFLPRLVVTLLAMIMFGPWAVSAVLDFTREIYLNIQISDADFYGGKSKIGYCLHGTCLPYMLAVLHGLGYGMHYWLYMFALLLDRLV